MEEEGEKKSEEDSMMLGMETESDLHEPKTLPEVKFKAIFSKWELLDVSEELEDKYDTFLPNMKEQKFFTFIFNIFFFFFSLFFNTSFPYFIFFNIEQKTY